MATPAPAQNPTMSPFVAAVSTHLSHVFIMEVWDIHNVFAADGSVNRGFRERTRRPPAAPTSPAWTPPNYTTGGSGLQRGTRMTDHEPAMALPTISEWSNSSARSTTGSTLSEMARRNMELGEMLQRSNRDPVANARHRPTEPTVPIPIDIEALTGPRPAPQFQPLSLYPSAMESSAAVCQTLSPAIEPRHRGHSVQFGDRKRHLQPTRDRRSLPLVSPEWLTREQNDALIILLEEEENESGTAQGCRFCGGTCNRGRDMCAFCILSFEGDGPEKIGR